MTCDLYDKKSGFAFLDRVDECAIAHDFHEREEERGARRSGNDIYEPKCFRTYASTSACKGAVSEIIWSVGICIFLRSSASSHASKPILLASRRANRHMIHLSPDSMLRFPRASIASRSASVFQKAHKAIRDQKTPGRSIKLVAPTRSSASKILQNFLIEYPKNHYKSLIVKLNRTKHY